MPFLNKSSVGNSGLYKGTTPPVNKNILWQDISSTIVILKYFNESSGQWEPVGGSGGTIDISIIDGGTWN